jgi:hypothetical protein
MTRHHQDGKSCDPDKIWSQIRLLILGPVTHYFPNIHHHNMTRFCCSMSETAALQVTTSCESYILSVHCHQKKNLYLLDNLLQQLYAPPSVLLEEQWWLRLPTNFCWLKAKSIHFAAIRTQDPILGCRELTTRLSPGSVDCHHIIIHYHHLLFILCMLIYHLLVDRMFIHLHSNWFVNVVLRNNISIYA